MIKTLKEKGGTAATAPITTVGFLLFFSGLLFVGAFLAASWADNTTAIGAAVNKPPTRPIKVNSYKPTHQIRSEIPLTCRPRNQSRHCPAHLPLKPLETPTGPSPPTCPDYFRWIHEDLRPWKDTGISLDMVQRARPTANFRLLIVNGKAYMERYQRSFQSRDKITLWGILQLLRRYPGQLPDLDLMFDCFDRPVIRASEYHRRKDGNGTVLAPPPLFRYCGNDETLDIAFPDWSFWGW